MATPRGRTNPTVKEALFEEHPGRFDFFQAVRLLTALLPDRGAVGYDSSPSDEIVRFKGDHRLAFHESDVHDLSVNENEPDEGQPRMTVSFMGLTGNQGVLPLHYTDYLVRYRDKHRIPAGEPSAPEEFFDIFLHRLVSMFYRAWEKHSIPVQYEKQSRGVSNEPFLGRYLLDLIGMGTAGLIEQVNGVASESLVFYGGLIAQRPHSAIALEGILSDYFQVDVRVEQFRGQWVPLEEDEWTDLVTEDFRNTLSEGAILGDAVWHSQSRIRLRVGPLSWKKGQFQDFLPGGKALPKLEFLTRFFLDWNSEFDVQLVLSKEKVPPVKFPDENETEEGKAVLLGYSTWLNPESGQCDIDDVILSRNLETHLLT
jgi:type VI secretion system protein ImpH